jgi:hypothetical protein
VGFIFFRGCYKIQSMMGLVDKMIRAGRSGGDVFVLFPDVRRGGASVP